jgi:hypothetical protein
MKLAAFKPIALEDVTGVPKGSDWAAKYVSPVSDQVKAITAVLQGKVGPDNLNWEVRTVEVKSGEAVEISCNALNGKPLGALLAAASRRVLDFTATPLDVRKIRLLVTFDVAPDVAEAVTVIVLGA